MPCRFRTTGIVVLELVGDLLGVVEALRDDEVHAHVAARPLPPGARRSAAASSGAAGGVVVGEDVVEVVAPAPASPGGGRSAARGSGPRARPRARRARPRRRTGRAPRPGRSRRAHGARSRGTPYRLRKVSPLGRFSCNSRIQPRAEAHDRRALLRGDREVLRRAHRQLAQAVLGGELRAARRTSGGCPPGRSANGGIVIRPTTVTGQRSRKASSSRARRRSCPPRRRR